MPQGPDHGILFLYLLLCFAVVKEFPADSADIVFDITCPFTGGFGIIYQVQRVGDLPFCYKGNRFPDPDSGSRFKGFAVCPPDVKLFALGSRKPVFGDLQFPPLENGLFLHSPAPLAGVKSDLKDREGFDHSRGRRSTVLIRDLSAVSGQLSVLRGNDPEPACQGDLIVSEEGILFTGSLHLADPVFDPDIPRTDTGSASCSGRRNCSARNDDVSLFCADPCSGGSRVCPDGQSTGPLDGHRALCTHDPADCPLV